MRFDAVLERLATLPDPLPAPADVLMPVVIGRDEPRPRGGLPPGRIGRPAAVLALLYPDDTGETRVVLIERAVGGHHSGEVSFPEPPLDHVSSSVALDTLDALLAELESTTVRIDGADALDEGSVAELEGLAERLEAAAESLAAR